MHCQRITLLQALDYEVNASWWAGYITWPWLQEVAALWFKWRVRRKFRKYWERREGKLMVRNAPGNTGRPA